MAYVQVRGMSTALRFRRTALQWLMVNDTCYQADGHYGTTTKLQQDCSYGH